MAKQNERPAESRPLPAHVVFTTASLYERAGFDSGAQLGEYFPTLTAGELRDLLVDVLQAHVIPRLDQNVQTLVIPTVHNPLRAVYVDGNSVRWTAEAGQGPTLTPSTVRVRMKDILACARRRKLSIPDAA